MITANELGRISAMHKQAKLDPAMANTLGFGGAGMLAGGGLGALRGALISENDQQGKPIGLLRRMLWHGTKGGLKGGALGGAAGLISTELPRLLANDVLKGVRDENYAQASALSKKSDPKLGYLGSQAERARLNAEAFLFDGQRRIFNDVSRPEQHKLIAKQIPLLYDNPLAQAANYVANPVIKYLNSEPKAKEKVSRLGSMNVRVDDKDNTVLHAVK